MDCEPVFRSGNDGPILWPTTYDKEYTTDQFFARACALLATLPWLPALTRGNGVVQSLQT